MLLALTFVDVECDGADCDSDHAFRVVEKLNGLGVQGKVISVLCVGDREGAPVSKAEHCTTALRPQRTRGSVGGGRVVSHFEEYLVLRLLQI